MKLTWHIVAKDLRRLKLPLALWVAVFLAEFAIGVRLLYGSTLSFPTFLVYQETDLVLSGLKAAIGYLLVPALIFEDVLVDTTAFWPTRPISGARLLGAKLLACLLIFGLLPILVTLPWWLFSGYGVHEIAGASLESLRFQVVPVAVGLMIAALTGSMFRFLGWTLLTAAAAVLSYVTLVEPAGTHLFIHGGDILAGAEVNIARLHLIQWLGIGACSLIVALQFLTRRLVRSLVILTCCVGFLAVELAWWPLDIGRPSDFPNGDGTAAPLDSRITIQLTEGPHLHIEGDSSDKSDAFIFGSLVVKNKSPGEKLRLGRPIFEWRWPDGHVSRQQGTILGWEMPDIQAEEMVTPHKAPSESSWEKSNIYKLMQKRGNQVPYEKYQEMITSRYDSDRDYYVELPRSDGLRMLSDPPSCTIEFQGDIVRPRLNAEIPLASGNAWAGNAKGFRIARSEWNDSAHSQQVLLTEHRSAIGEATFNLGNSNPYGGSDGSFVVINRPRGESSWPDYYGNFISIRIATVAIAWRAGVFRGPSNLQYEANFVDGKWTGPYHKDWFSDASLGNIVEAVDGRFSRKVPIEKFTVSLDGFSKAP